jgi:hypothetical protein
MMIIVIIITTTTTKLEQSNKSTAYFIMFKCRALGSHPTRNGSGDDDLLNAELKKLHPFIITIHRIVLCRSKKI